MNKSNMLQEDPKAPAEIKVNAKLYRDEIKDPKVNSQYKPDDEMLYLDKEYLLLFRSIFTVKPRQMVAIFYKTNERVFYMYIWNTKNSLH